MTEEKKQEKKNINDFSKYQYGVLAGQFMKDRKTQAYVPGALDMLSSDLKLGEDAIGFIEGTYSSAQGLQKASEIYSGLFEKKISEYKPSEVLDWYNPVLKGLGDEAKSALIDKFSTDSTFGEIQGKIEKNSYILQAPGSLFSEKDKVKAKEELEKLEGFNQARGFLDSYMIESLRPKAIEASKKKTLDSMVESWKQL